MRNTSIFSFAIALALTFTAPPVAAQKVTGPQDLKTFKPGARGFRKPPAPRKIKDLKANSGKIQEADRKAPPGAAKKGDGKGAQWEKDAARSQERPTLSADFIKNCEPLPPGVRVNLDIYDEELDHVVKLIACLTNRNIILPKPLKGKKITIYSPRMVTGNEAYQAFLTALKANDLTISQQGKFLEIIDIKDYENAAPRILGPDSTPPDQDRMVTQMVNLKHIDATEISELLKNLATKNASFLVYAPSNSLIITETGSNLRKLHSILNTLDVPGGKEQMWTYQVEFAEAQEIAAKINEIFEQSKSKSSANRNVRNNPRAAKGKKAPTTASSSSVGDSEFEAQVSKVMADERTNRLFIMATARSYRQVKKLIKQLDVDIPGDGQVHIHQLNHAKAVDLATVLSNLSQEQRSRANATRGRAAPRPGAKSTAKTPSATSSSAALFEGEISVTADEDTNSLVITASLKDYISLKKVIDQLDRPRRQVFIEAIIMEVSIRNNRKFGISAHGGSEESIAGESVPVLMGSQTAIGTSLDITSAAGFQGLAAAAFTSGKSIEIGGVDIPAFGVLVNALAQSTDVNILSTPHVLTTDNEEAEIVVGSNVPFVSSMVGSSLGGAGASLGGFFPTVNIQRTDVALTLKLTPRVNAANYVTLEIDQVIEEIEGLDERLGPTTSKRSVKNTVTVKDQNTVVIGGLQKSRQLNGRTGVPILGEIPVIGYLFRSSTKEQERRNLLLMLTPYVIESEADFQAIYRRKMEEHREFLARFHKDGDEIVLGVDYGKKHGLLEAINKSLDEVEAEEKMLEELRLQEARPPLPQELDGVDLDEGKEEKQANISAEDVPEEAS